jgi:hypothetical protein
MQKLLIALALSAAVIGLPAAPAMADVSHTQHLPVAACNQGTMNAHANIPATTGTGTTTPGHDAVPGTAFVTPCGHGG